MKCYKIYIRLVIEKRRILIGKINDYNQVNFWLEKYGNKDFIYEIWKESIFQSQWHWNKKWNSVL